MLQRLALARLADAKALLRSRRYDGAYYLAGYAVECALKACIAKKTKQFDFPDRNVQKVFTHDLARLLELAELTDAFEHEKTNDHSLELNWNTVKDWREQARYEKHTAVNAKRLVLAIADRKHGLLRCLKKILVGELVDEGQRVIDELRRRRLQVRAAFWVELPDTDYWRFVVALPYVNRNGTFEAYKVLREALEAIQPEVLSLEDIYVVSPHGDDFKAYLAAAGGPGRLGMGAASGRPPRVVFEDSYVYSVD